MAEEMNTPFEEQEQKEELTIKFAKGVCSEPFMSKEGKELVRIKIPNADENDHRPWQSFVLGVNQVHENQYGKGLWAKLLLDGHTTVSRPFPDGTDDKGRKIWKTEKREVSNRELKEMVEYYKTQSKEDRDPAPADRQAQKEEPEAETEGDRTEKSL